MSRSINFISHCQTTVHSISSPSATAMSTDANLIRMYYLEPFCMSKSRQQVQAHLCIQICIRFYIKHKTYKDVSVKTLFLGFPFCFSRVKITNKFRILIWYDSVYLTCSKKLTGSQLSPPHGTNKKLKCETKNKTMSMIGPVQSRYHEAV